MADSPTNDIHLQEYKLRQSHAVNFWHALLGAANASLNFFGLRSTKRFWGIVYDSVTKQPLDPVIVKLLYLDGRETETCVTDLDGHYGFLARPGKFKIFVRKSNYIFPSVIVKGNNDGVYSNLYHGEFFELHDDREVVAPNIPMDPEKPDWNQTAKLSVVRKHFYFQLLFNRLGALLFWFGLLLAFLVAWRLFPREPGWLFFVFGFYALFILFFPLLPEPRLWGSLKVASLLPFEPEGLTLELFKPDLPGISFCRFNVRPGGKFLLRVGAGRYVLWANSLDKQGVKTQLASCRVTVGRNGVFNGSLFLGFKK